jgi:hypothetical protein
MSIARSYDPVSKKNCRPMLNRPPAIIGVLRVRGEEGILQDGVDGGAAVVRCRFPRKLHIPGEAATQAVRRLQIVEVIHIDHILILKCGKIPQTMMGLAMRVLF